MRILKKLVRKLYHLIWFLSIFIFFLPIVKAESYGGALNTDISSPFRVMAFDDYGNYIIPRQNSAYLFETPYNVSCQYGVRTCGFSFETQQSYAAGHYYGITIYLYYENTNYRIVPPPSGARRIGMGNSMNAARINWVNNNNDVSQVIYTNYSYDNFAIKLSNNAVISGVYSITYFFKTITNNIGIAVPFNIDANVSSGIYYFVGYVLTDLGSADGLTESQVTHAIQNSGLATASSVQEVQRGVNQVQQQLSGVQDSVDDVNDTLKDDDAPTIDLSDIETSDTPISDLVVLPLTLLNSIYNGISGSCASWTLPLPFNHSYTIPCFTIGDYVGSSVANIIDMAICLFMAYEIILLFIRIFDDITTLSDTYTNWVKRGRY